MALLKKEERHIFILFICVLLCNTIIITITDTIIINLLWCVFFNDIHIFYIIYVEKILVNLKSIKDK